jgi:hypothetical protein
MFEPPLPAMVPRSQVSTRTALSRIDLPSGVTTRNEPYQVPEKAEQEASLVCADNGIAITRRQTAPNTPIFISILDLYGMQLQNVPHSYHGPLGGVAISSVS